MIETPDDPTAFFWDASQQALGVDGVETSTMMGFPCLRVNGAFFASCDHRNGDLIVKLPEERVQQLIAAGPGKPFAPAGRIFRQWVLVADRDPDRWRTLIAEARTFVETCGQEQGAKGSHIR
jgi:hypothetical protein